MLRKKKMRKINGQAEPIFLKQQWKENRVPARLRSYSRAGGEVDH
jgi:hypothetical protein